VEVIRGPYRIDSIVGGRTSDKRVRCARVPDITSYTHDSPRVVGEPTIDALENVVRVVAVDGGYDPEAHLVCALTEAGVVYQSPGPGSPFGQAMR